MHSSLWRFIGLSTVVAALLLVAFAMQHVLSAESHTFDGPWDTSYGFMELKVDGHEVSGSYLFNGEHSTIDGEMADDKTLVFTYHETVASGSGSFILSDDGQSFRGRWWKEDGRAWRTWNGKRPAEAIARDYNGVWDTEHGRMRLIQNGKEVSGIFAGGIGNSIEGSAEGRKLTFRTMEGDSRGEGWLELSRDGSSFSGQRRSGTDGAWKEVSGTRLMPETGITWLVVLEANWEESLSEAEYNFGDIIKSYFAGTPYVRVRHRRFANEDDLRYWLSEIPYLAEPTVVVVSSHGAADGIFGSADYKPIPASAFSDVLRYASNLKLLHLAACLTMKGDYSKKILKRVPADVRFPISGYATSVDWAGSALADLLYYEFVLGRGYEPQQAFNEILKLMPVAGKKSEKGAEIPALDMRIVMPRDVGR